MSPNSPEVTGQILCSFDVCEADTEFEVPTSVYNLSKYIKMNQICFEIQVLGLRRLQSVGILPVKKASIKFGFSNLLPQGSDLA